MNRKIDCLATLLFNSALPSKTYFVAKLTFCSVKILHVEKQLYNTLVQASET